MATIIQFPRPPQPADGDGEGPTEIVVRIVFESSEEPPDEPEDEPDEEPPAKPKVGWGWFWLGALFGLGLGG
ncbi:MAG: hypothetical protein WBM40_17460 [Thiohalocapsa sp.]